MVDILAELKELHKEFKDRAEHNFNEAANPQWAEWLRDDHRGRASAYVSALLLVDSLIFKIEDEEKCND